MGMYNKDEVNFDNIPEDQALEYGYGFDEFNSFEIQDHLNSYLRFFCRKDLDIIYLYFILGKRQNDLSVILEKTQPAISYDVKRIKRQIEFVMYLASVVDEFLSFVVTDKKLTVEEKDLLIAFFFSTSYTKTAKILGLHQITCRSKLNKIIEKLKDLECLHIYDIFIKIVKNLNKVKKTVCKKR